MNGHDIPRTYDPKKVEEKDIPFLGGTGLFHTPH